MSEVEDYWHRLSAIYRHSGSVQIFSLENVDSHRN